MIVTISAGVAYEGHNLLVACRSDELAQAWATVRTTYLQAWAARLNVDEPAPIAPDWIFLDWFRLQAWEAGALVGTLDDIECDDHPEALPEVLPPIHTWSKP